jgi:undecaprenyl-phosphate galactose phosphotransferase
MTRSRGQVIYDEPFTTTQESSGVAEGLLTIPLVVPGELPVESWQYRYLKRTLDVVGGLVMLAVFLIPGVLIALAILITSPYPVFYSEERVGRNGVPFRIWKFRSMRPHPASHRMADTHSEGVVLRGRMEKRGHDPRVTAIGRFLRRWSLDEVPQVLNVLRGDMSLIGPRPIVKAETYYYKHLLSYYLAAKPGLSGLWQVSGRSDLGYPVRARLDASYVQNWSLKADIMILLRTIPAVLRRVGAR